MNVILHDLLSICSYVKSVDLKYLISYRCWIVCRLFYLQTSSRKDLNWKVRKYYSRLSLGQLGVLILVWVYVVLACDSRLLFCERLSSWISCRSVCRATNICECMHFLKDISLSTRYFAGISLDGPVVTSCGTGVTACILALVSPFFCGYNQIPIRENAATCYMSHYWQNILVLSDFHGHFT